LELAGVMPPLHPVKPVVHGRPRKPRPSKPRQHLAEPRPQSMGRVGLTRAERDAKEKLEWDIVLLDQRRPKKFSECKRGPCPWVGCRFHLFLEVNEETGFIKLNHPNLQPEDLKEPCALRVQRKVQKTGEETSLKRVARLLNVTDERVRQIENTAIEKLKLIAKRDLLRIARPQNFGRPPGGALSDP
jgi:hypothetical protein